MLNLSTQKLRIAQLVAQKKGVTRAAAQLQMTPSAVSQCISGLEQEWGEQLFVRVGKEMLPTKKALKMLEISSEYFEQISSLRSGSKHQSLTGEVRIGSVPLYAARILTPKLWLLHQTQPSVRYSVTILDTRKLIQELKNFRIDIAFTDYGATPGQHEGLTVEPVYKEKLYLCGSRDFFRLQGRRDIASSRGNVVDLEYKELKILPHISYHNEKGALFKWYRHHFKKQPPSNYPITIESVEGVASAIDLGFGVGIIPESIAASRFESNEWVHIRGGKTPLVNSILMCQLANRIPDAVQRLVCKNFRIERGDL